MLSPERRLLDAQSQLQFSREEEQRALLEEMQSWYFGASELNTLGASPSELLGMEASGFLPGYVDEG